MQWLHEERGYTLATTSIYLKSMSDVVRWLHSRRIDSLTDLTLQDLKAAHCCFPGRNPAARYTARALEQFLRAEGTVSEGVMPAPSPTEHEAGCFAAYLCEARGLSKVTIREHQKRLRKFLEFLQFDRSPSRLQQLRARDIEAFLQKCARTNNRFSLQHIVATVRAFLQWRYARGLLTEPLHQQIDTPRVYRGERLPRAIPWEQVQALLASIGRGQGQSAH